MISVENVQSTSSTELFRIQQGGALPSRGGVLEPSISMSLEGDLFFSRWNLIAVRPASAVNMWSLDCGVACVISLIMSPYDVDSLVWCCFCGVPFV